MRLRMGERADSGPSRRNGFTLIELVVSFSALLVLMLGFTRVLLSTSMASSTTHEAALAKEAARSVVEALRAVEFEDAFALYNDDPEDDPGGVVAPGNNFAVTGLQPRRDDADGFAGEILFPLQNGELCETLELPQFGLPADLNGDGDDDDVDVTDDHLVLPVVVRVEWQSSGNTARLELNTWIGGF